jgi:RNA polymerase sigma-70 factor (ECF subfamily)
LEITMTTLLCETEYENETEIVLAAQRGERAAFGELFTRYERVVYATAFRRLGNHAEAQEVLQEVFMRALRKIGQLRQPEAFAGWLKQIAVRTAINRAMRRPADVATDPEAMTANYVDHETPLGFALAKERRTKVRAGLKKLRRLDRETLTAFYLRGQSLIEMSNQFESPVGTIKRRLHVARKRLAKELSGLQTA